jgi:hypothetical protein
MKIFTGLLILFIGLAATWLVTGVVAQISPRDYVELSAPWWHLALHLAWFLTGLAASMKGVALLYERWSRRKKLARQQPKQA